MKIVTDLLIGVVLASVTCFVAIRLNLPPKKRTPTTHKSLFDEVTRENDERF